jgi:CheY-like chemotaxis protein
MGARTLTTMFTDLAGSTRAWAGLERGTADRRRARHFELMGAKVAEHRGREVKNLGDGIMAVFESVGDAVACAGAMQQAFAAAEGAGEPMLGLRVGLATGDVNEEDEDAGGALAAVRRERPDVVVLDIRMPPSFSTDGLDVAEELLAERPDLGVILLSTHLNPAYAERLLAAGHGRGVGYLAKERVSDIDEFAAAVHRVAAGGTAFDPQIADALGW